MKHNLLIVLVLLILASCGGNRESEQLRQVASVVNNNPELALAKLDSIDLSSLNTANRHYYDFLSVKAADKAYILHTSDSLIRSVINYYESSPDELLPEVYYYGGRVYSDLGDAPQALAYFQQALDCVPTEDIELRGRIVSQMANHYANHFLYAYAIEKVKESIEIDKQLSDTFGLVYDNRMLGRIYGYIHKNDSALHYFSEGLKLSYHLSPSDIALLKVAYSSSLANNGRYSDARRIMTPSLLDSIPQHAYYSALADYLHVYIALGEYELAEKYAMEIIEAKPDISLLALAYGALSDIEIKSEQIGKLTEHIRLYKLATDSTNRTISHAAMSYQKSNFDYSLRERENIRLLKENYNNKIIIYSIVIICTLLCLTLIYFISAHKHKKLELKLTLEKLKRLNKERDKVVPYTSSSLSELRQEIVFAIKHRIETSIETDYGNPPKEILDSEIYQQFINISNDNTKIASEEQWKKLSDLIDVTYPDFKNNLEFLLGTLTIQDYRICILTKCFFTPTQISTIIIKSKSAISNSRARMSERAFGQKLSSSYWDKVVHSL